MLCLQGKNVQKQEIEKKGYLAMYFDCVGSPQKQLFHYLFIFFFFREPTNTATTLWPLRNPYRHLIFPNMASYFSNTLR